MTPMKYVKRGWPDWEISIKTHVSGIMWSRTELFRPKTPQNLCQPAQTTFNRKLPTSNINKRRKNWPTDSRDGHRCVSKLFQIHVDTTLFIIYNLQHDYNLFVIHHSTFFSSTNFVLISLLIYRKKSGNNRLQFFKRRHFITTELLCKCTPPITSALIALHWLYRPKKRFQLFLYRKLSSRIVTKTCKSPVETCCFCLPPTNQS
jgi:hypothetical protein